MSVPNEPNDDPDTIDPEDADHEAERAEIHFLAALTDELMRTLMTAGVLTQAQLNEIEQAVATRTGSLPRAW